jgi:hypothetical protein
MKKAPKIDQLLMIYILNTHFIIQIFLRIKKITVNSLYSKKIADFKSIKFSNSTQSLIYDNEILL